MVFKFGWLRNIQKYSQWSYRVCRGKINVYETFKFKSVYLKQAKQNTGGVSVSRRTDRLQLSQNSHTAWTRPKHGAKSVPCCQSAPMWSFCLSSPRAREPRPWRGGGKSIFSNVQICGHLCAVVPLKTSLIFSEKQSVSKLYQVKTTLQLSAICYLLSQLNTFL